MQKEVWTDEKGYWFLNILTTHPDSQGKGIGGALVRHITRMVFSSGVLSSQCRPTRMDGVVTLKVASLHRTLLSMNVWDLDLSRK